jgi:hypothetical protein
MPFVPFAQHFPEVARQETRTITVLPGSDLGVPPGEYGFVEIFCDEPGCDCRRVMFSVLSSARQGLEAVIAWGWEDRAFYARWLPMSNPWLAAQMQGPILNPGSPRTPYSDAVLQMAKALLLTDPAYVARVKRHYAMFRERINGKTGGRPARRSKRVKGAPSASMGRWKRSWRRGP